MSKLTLYGIWLSGPTYKAGLALSLMGQPFAYKHVDLGPARTNSRTTSPSTASARFRRWSTAT